jgi:serine/threonine-protein kinase RsbW
VTQAEAHPADTGTPKAPVGYGVTLAVCLPRDAMSVPIVRHLVRYALDEVGVLEETSNDIELALTEACANVMDHAGPGDRYEVTVTIGAERCELRVVDIGHGFDHHTVASAPQGDGHLNAERGRGLGLMHALVDHIELLSEPEAGTLVRLVKRLAFDEHAPARRLLFQALHAATAEPADAAPYPTERTLRAGTAETATASHPD